MTPLHHLDHATLVSYASGALPQALSLATAAHMELCAQCRGQLREAERIGGALVQQHRSTVVPIRGRSAMLARLDEAAPADTPHRPPQTIDADLLPACLHETFGERYSQLQWKTLLPGIRRVQAKGVREGNLMLLNIAPGMAMPVHSHGGSELTLVLKGAYEDRLGLFKPGDIADLDEDIEHQPIVAGDQPCICLAATDAPLRFNGWVSRLLQPLFKI
ncbi:ChrR family anti-sigma-E factor [Pseudomonas sp. LJDD11]|uniref:ChrR family anti-sigma-E factor n=1 Tax=Pseudomonas sp. LJDD11 TaxID=2931984 RepID=UPI00211D00DC|nr:ChrR family anti-sigma-E factor [Pseudomonas sp. LJDD11]MCQ9425662.1 ChrR family anti-sigma-E factor [Pseudomonas sp. LJDD11]